jgi:glutamate N-acetyltransferase/amino-acid N-acetyltransferase
VINNKVSNVCSGGDGVANAELVCEAVAKGLNLPGGAKTVLPCSTGVIGWRLPAKELAEQVVPQAITQLKSESALPAALAIMTTDRFPKVRSITLSNGARIVGIAKGAGMIEPNLATMLSYIMTDATVDQATMQRLLSNVVQGSFNSISVDGDESTSDTVVWLSSNQASSVSEDELEKGLRHVCQGLAADIVRNGEGTSHVLRVSISNYPGTSAAARRLGRHIVNSPLFKCAVCGNDPNTGRLAAAIGSWLGKFYGDGGDEPLALEKVTMTLGGRTIFANSKFVLEGDEVEKALSQHIQDAEYSSTSHYPPHQKCVEIQVDFGTGSGQAVVLGSDLTNEYIAVNADYRS